MGKSVKLYRVVCEAEFQQLMKTRKFQCIPASIQGKWFAESIRDAIKWGKWFSAVDGILHERIVEIEMPTDRADKLQRRSMHDGIGPARYAALGQLNGVVPREVPYAAKN
jgi:hypothetical protein